jgi:pilus assembly protein CpaF
MSELAALKGFLEDPLVSDVLVDGHLSVQVERNGNLETSSNPFQDELEVVTWIRNLLRNYGSRLDIAKPISETTFDSEYGLLRVHAVLGGECSKRTQISIRRHASSNLSLRDLVSKGSVTEQQLDNLLEIVNSRENFVIIGGTGSGKTTLLKAVLGETSHERIITIEDVAELNLSGNSVGLITRAGNHEGAGQVTLGHLVREALRMRPDRLIIGEARGEELLLLLQAINTGHNGSGFTLHANSIQDAWPRMLGILVGTGVSIEFAQLLISSSISWVIEVKRISGNRAVYAIQRLRPLHV